MPSLPPRYILHVAFPRFPVSIEIRREPQLAASPLILGGQGGRSVVMACNEAAQAMGVQPGMAVRKAAQLCPAARLRPYDRVTYQLFAARIGRWIEDRVPLYEAGRLGAFFVDLSGMERFFGIEEVAQALGAFLAEKTAFPLQLGLAHNKLLAQMASAEAEPGTLFRLPAEEIGSFLQPLSVHKFPGVGQETTQTLSRLGVRTIGALRQIPRPGLMQVFGKRGQRLYEMARGIDDRPLVPPQAPHSLSREMTFDPDCDDPATLLCSLTQLVEELGFQLRQRNLLTSRLSLHLRYNSGEDARVQRAIPACASDEGIVQQARACLPNLYQRRMRIRHLRLQLMELTPGNPQLLLFQPPARQVELYRTLDMLRVKYGVGVIRRGSGIKETGDR